MKLIKREKLIGLFPRQYPYDETQLLCLNNDNFAGTYYYDAINDKIENKHPSEKAYKKACFGYGSSEQFAINELNNELCDIIERMFTLLTNGKREIKIPNSYIGMFEQEGYFYKLPNKKLIYINNIENSLYMINSSTHYEKYINTEYCEPNKVYLAKTSLVLVTTNTECVYPVEIF